MLKLDQMLSFSDLHLALERPLYMVFEYSTSFLAPPCLLKRKRYVDSLCLIRYRTESFLHSARISVKGFFSPPNPKAFMQKPKCQHT